MISALVVSRFFPFNTTRVHAVYQRLGMQVAALAQVVDRVTCLFLVPKDQERSEKDLAIHEQDLRLRWTPKLTLRLATTADESPPSTPWQQYGAGIFDFRWSSIAKPLNNGESRAALTAALTESPNIVLAHRLSAMSLLMSLPTPIAAPIMFDLDDIEHVAWRRRLTFDPSWPAERLLLLQVPRLFWAEREATLRSAVTFVCSTRDRARLMWMAPSARVEVLPNSSDLGEIADPVTPDPVILFVGSMGSRPNAQAVDYLVSRVWPRVAAHVPSARLIVIGSAPELTHSYSNHPSSVTFAGFVGDLDPWYRKATAVCCPIFHGSGTRVKIIEAASRGVPVISTGLGAEGLDFLPGKEILIEESAERLAAACIRLLRDPILSRAIGTAARARMESSYNREALIQRLANVFRVYSEKQ